MTPVAIGDTKETLQARKTCKSVYNHPETLLWVYRYMNIQVGQGSGCIVIIFCTNSHLRDSSLTLIETYFV